MPVLGIIHGTKIGPNAPTITSVTDVGLNREFDNGAVDVAFTLPGVNTAISYKVTSSNGRVATGNSSPIRVQNLPTGINTTFTITGTNNITIEGPISTVSTGVIVTTVPFRPTIGVATEGNTQGFVLFSLLNSGGKAVISYVATGSPSGSANNTGSPITVSGLTNGTPHAFTVVAVNANGPSLPSNPSNVITPFVPSVVVDPPTTTYYCYSSDCLSQDGRNFAYVQAPVFTSAVGSDQSSFTSYVIEGTTARGTRKVYCNTVQQTALVGAQQASCQNTYVEPAEPPPCPSDTYETPCGTPVAGQPQSGCSGANYGYTITSVAPRTRTIRDCNGILLSTVSIPCVTSAFTTTVTNDIRCPGYVAQVGPTRVAGDSAVVTNPTSHYYTGCCAGTQVTSSNYATYSAAYTVMISSCGTTVTNQQSGTGHDIPELVCESATPPAGCSSNPCVSYTVIIPTCDGEDSRQGIYTGTRKVCADGTFITCAEPTFTSFGSMIEANNRSCGGSGNTSTTNQTNSNPTNAPITATNPVTTTQSPVGTLTRDPNGAGYTDPVEGNFVWYSTTSPDGTTNLYLLPETNGTPVTTSLSSNSNPAVSIPPINFDYSTPSEPTTTPPVTVPNGVYDRDDDYSAPPATVPPSQPVAEAPAPVYEYDFGGFFGDFCFAFGTKITMADGSFKNIEDLKLGDSLKTFNIPTLTNGDAPEAWSPKEVWSVATTENFENATTTVSRFNTGTYGRYYKINNKIKVTHEHWILVKRDSLWQFMQVADMRIGDYLLGQNKEEVEVFNIEFVPSRISVVNLDVEENDMYFADGILAHNFFSFK